MFGVGGKAWCLTNPDACNALFPYMAWGFLIAGIITIYRVYKWTSWERWYEFVAAIFFTLLGIAGIWITNFPLPDWAVL